MYNSVLIQVIKLLALCGIFLHNPLIASQWKPLCVKGSSCESPYHVTLGGGTGGYHPIDRHAAGPLVTDAGILLHHTPHTFPVLDAHTNPVRHIFELSTERQDDLGEKFYISDANSIETPTGKKLSFFLGGAVVWLSPDEEPEIIDWVGDNGFYSSHAEIIGPPVILDNVIFTGIRDGGASSIHMSTDDGYTWTKSIADIRIGDDRFNLLENPEKSALWAINSEFKGSLGSLWESNDHGTTWQQVDNGSFPFDAVRVVHDPQSLLVSYALTSHGLFVSVDRGISWDVTSMKEAVHGMIFAERMPGLTRALIVGTDTGVWVSVDEAASWVSMARNLPGVPHTVTFGHGQLIATSDEGYFTCNAIDCAGLATPAEITATSGAFNNRVKVSWKPVEGATVYRVFRCPDDNVKYCGFPIRFARETTIADHQATHGKIQHYRVRACTANSCSNFSATDTGFVGLKTPTNIEASDGTFSDRIRVKWKPVEGATVYRVFRCPGIEISNCGRPIGYPKQAVYDDTMADSGTEHHYRIRACTEDTCSKFSETSTGYIIKSS